jgi:hypothetical protein
MPVVQHLDDDPSGLAMMLGGLIEANLESHPERRELLKRGVVALVVTDAEVAITIRLAPRLVTIAAGITGRPQIVLRTDTATLTDLTSTPLRFGLADPATAEGRAVLGKLRSGELKVSGMVRHAALLSRINRLLSIA